MKQEHVEKIKSYYDRTGEFKKNEKYSGRDKTICALSHRKGNGALSSARFTHLMKMEIK